MYGTRTASKESRSNGERFVAAQPEAVGPALAGILDAQEAGANAAAAALGLEERAPLDSPRVLFVLGVLAVLAAWWVGLGYGVWLMAS
jgi:hypothetical protein